MTDYWRPYESSFLVDNALRGPDDYKKMIHVMTCGSIEQCINCADDLLRVINRGQPTHKAMARRLRAHALRQAGILLKTKQMAHDRWILSSTSMITPAALARVADDVFAALIECDDPATVEEILEVTTPERLQGKSKRENEVLDIVQYADDAHRETLLRHARRYHWSRTTLGYAVAELADPLITSDAKNLLLDGSLPLPFGRYASKRAKGDLVVTKGAIAQWIKRDDPALYGQKLAPLSRNPALLHDYLFTQLAETTGLHRNEWCWLVK
ncbi:MAG TPA: hypothetical protein VG328_07380 [Stellaceae bacterium]|jgi:hypothetical protein|nr:hypothetical protein [Stellaceae bacterium]